ncbi:PREDICTED: NDR1/HIN1-like protein 12 [Nelumbo nucifera]|uniref:NDR1/HIN1-like protein 12 n=1 Tax=Nelumbo nucifera TaxID=4432 RepID=A0A1U8ATK7_NELNU|nr:PREDICTED: NDR1/HIN1-like protein 12 [Nelumbo nucifera]
MSEKKGDCGKHGHKRNPNDKISIYYNRLDVFVEYSNQQITLPTRLPPTYEGHKDFNIWSPFIYGSNVLIAPYPVVSLSQDQNIRTVLIKIKVYGRVRWKKMNPQKMTEKLISQYMLIIMRLKEQMTQL